MIFCWSAHHTATWTTLKWLDSHSDVAGVLEVRFLEKALLEGSYSYLTTQVWAGKGTVLQDHFVNSRGENFLDLRALGLALGTRTVIPLRDPLAVCLTAQHRTEIRGQGFSGLDAIEELKILGRAIPLLRAQAIHDPVFIPWDLAPGPVARDKWLQQFRWELGLEDRGATFEWAQRWPIENTKGGYAYKSAYIQRDARWLERRLPEVWAGLRGLEPRLRPFLEDSGYSDLLWWGK